MNLSARGWIAPIGLGLMSLLLYVSSLERAPHPDELYHMLAAQGLIETGEPSIGENGRYWRGYPLTWIVARSIEAFGPSLTAGRLPPTVFAVALVVLLFVFLRREAGVLPAWIGAGLFAVSPFAIDMAQFVRFYSLQCLAFFAGAWLVYVLVSHPLPPLRRLMGAVVAVALLAFAAHLQPTTLLGITGLAAWAAGAIALPWIFAPHRTPREQHAIVLGLLGAGCIVVLAMLASGVLGALWADFRATPLFNRPSANIVWFYHAWYILFYPTLWSLVGLITVLALIHRTRLASFLLMIFAVGFILNSLAGQKNLRYIAYAQPFLFALWGVGLGYLINIAGTGVLERLRHALAERFSLLPARWAEALGRLLVFGAFFFLILVNPAWLRSATMLAEVTIPPEIPTTDWPAAQPVLQPWLDEAAVMVTSDELGPLFFYGRADILFNASRYEEGAGSPYPFRRDFRTDVPAINDAASLELVIDCHASGLFLIEAKFWGIDGPLRDVAAENLLISRATPLALPATSQLVAFVWRHAVPDPMPAACARLSAILTAPAAPGVGDTGAWHPERSRPVAIPTRAVHAG